MGRYVKYALTYRPIGPRFSAAARGPAEVADREQQAGDAPERDDCQVSPLQAAAAAWVIDVEEGLEEVTNRKEVGEVDDPTGQLIVGDEDPGEEVERQQQRVDDRCRGVLRRDRGGQGDAEAAEGGGSDQQREDD